MGPADVALHGETHPNGELTRLPDEDIAVARYEPISEGARNFLFKVIGGNRIDDLLQEDAVEISLIIIGEVAQYRKWQDKILALPPEKAAMSRRIEKMARLAVRDYTVEQIAAEVEPKADPELVNGIVGGFANIICRHMATGNLPTVVEYIGGIDWDGLAARRAEFILSDDTPSTNGEVSAAAAIETQGADQATEAVEDSRLDEAKEEDESQDLTVAATELAEVEQEEPLTDAEDEALLEEADAAEAGLTELDPELLLEDGAEEADDEEELLGAADTASLDVVEAGGLGEGIDIEVLGRPLRKPGKKKVNNKEEKTWGYDSEQAKEANALRDRIVARLKKKEKVSRSYAVLNGHSFELTELQHEVLGLLIQAAGDIETQRELTIDRIYRNKLFNDLNRDVKNGKVRKVPRKVQMAQHIPVAYSLWWMVEQLDEQFGKGAIIKTTVQNRSYLQYSINPSVINQDLLVKPISIGSDVRISRSVGTVRQGSLAGSRM